MRAFLKENKSHGTRLFPFQHYKVTNPGNGIFIPCHWHPEIEITFVISGTVRLLLDGTLYSLQKGDICFVNSGSLHQAESADPDAIYYAYVFSMSSLDFLLEDSAQLSCIDPLKNTLCFPAFLPRTAACHAMLSRQIQELISCNENRSPAFELRTKAALYNIISCLYAESLFEPKRPKEISSARDKDVRTMLLYMQKHYQERIYLEEAAAFLHMSPKYFCSYFKSVFGKSFTAYLNHLRIEQACLLLSTTDMSVMEIGFETGFENFSYFIKTFKNAMGCTPGQYRD